MTPLLDCKKEACWSEGFGHCTAQIILASYVERKPRDGLRLSLYSLN